MKLEAERFDRGAAIIAGGSGGIGSAVCRMLAGMGSDVAFTYRNNEDAAKRTVEAIESLGRRALAIQADLSDAGSVSQALTTAVGAFGSLHTAVYAAGPYLPLNVMARITPAQFQEIISNDLFGAFNFLHFASEPLLEQEGVMVAIVTPAMDRWAATDGLSAIPKAGVQQIIRGYAAEHGAQGLRANCVGVGLIEGGMVVQMLDQNIIDKTMAEKFIGRLPLPRMGKLEEVASAVAFLSSDLSRYTTGQTLMVDGGYSV